VRRIAFDPDKLEGEPRAQWVDWEANAREATERMLEEHPDGKNIKLNSDIWAALKKWLFWNVFDGKCAYCEGDVAPVSYGAAEHWRPKGAVTTREGGKDVVVVHPESGEPHPGYYWLAYDWRNLVPACDECNTGSGEYRGKGSQFPIAGQRAFRPEDAATFDELNELEQPLLLHPFGQEEPGDYLDFDEYGQPVAKTVAEGKKPLGEASINVFNLDRPWPNGRRQRLCHDLRLKVKEALGQELLGGRDARETLLTWTAPDRPFSLAANVYSERWRASVIAKLAAARTNGSSDDGDEGV
jgi:hypothetical protein